MQQNLPGSRPNKSPATNGSLSAGRKFDLELDVDRIGERRYLVTEDTFIRVQHPGVREPFAQFAQVTKPGMRLVVVFEGQRAVMLRKASEA